MPLKKQPHPQGLLIFQFLVTLEENYIQMRWPLKAQITQRMVSNLTQLFTLFVFQKIMSFSWRFLMKATLPEGAEKSGIKIV